jgi:ribonuclease HII
MTSEAWIAGVDEVGRGAWFGPVVAAAVVLPQVFVERLQEAGLTDSKKLSAKQRVALDQQIRQMAWGEDPLLSALDQQRSHANYCIHWQLGLASVAEIDRLNISQASLLAMKRAVLKLDPQPDRCLIDGKLSIPNLPIVQETIVQGDQRCLAIAAASVIAKVWRDGLLDRLGCQYPGYDLACNKGYGTPKHRVGLQTLGPSPQHRSSFAPVKASFAEWKR